MRPAGEFIRGDGLVIPNNVTTLGAAAILAMAMRGQACTMAVGLCNGVYAPGMVIGDLVEPASTHGYARIALTRNSTDWLTTGVLNGERYVESKALVWAASGGDFRAAITRMFIFMVSSDFTGGIFALSSAFPEPLIITPTTLLADRTFKYRLYLR